MKFRRVGKIFDAVPENLPEGCFGFAQSPQALGLGDRLRVYFSTRIREGDTPYVKSIISYADFTADRLELIAVARKPVLWTGERGCFDEHGIFPINPVRAGERILGYTTGWSRRVSTSVETAIGLVESLDGGDSFTRTFHGPVMAATLNEPCLVGDGFVCVDGGEFHMWYIFGLGWRRYPQSEQPERIYKIAHATSENGLDWSRDSRPIMPDLLGSDECQALPSVIKFEDRWHMVFCYRHAHGFRSDPGRGYRLGYAHSTDRTTWTRDDAALTFEGAAPDWDRRMQCYPHLCLVGGVPYLFYNGNNFGRDGFGVAVLTDN